MNWLLPLICACAVAVSAVHAADTAAKPVAPDNGSKIHALVKQLFDPDENKRKVAETGLSTLGVGMIPLWYEQEGRNGQAIPADVIEKYAICIEVLNTVRIPQIDFREADVLTIIDFICNETQRRDPGGRGLSFATRQTPSNRTIRSLRLRDRPVLDILNNVTDLMGMESGVTIGAKKGIIVIQPKGTEARRAWYAAVGTIELEDVRLVDADINDIIRFLSAEDRKLRPHFRVDLAFVHPPNGKPLKKLTYSAQNVKLSELVDRVANLLELDYSVEDKTFIFKPKQETTDK